MSSSRPILCPASRSMLALVNTPGIAAQAPRSPSRSWRTKAGSAIRAGPENTKSTASTLRAISSPIGVSQLAPPIRVTTSGLRSFSRRAMAKVAVF